jgi:phospholipase/carboxylesterase
MSSTLEQSIAGLAGSMLAALYGLEAAFRALHPPNLRALRAEIAKLLPPLVDATAALRAAPTPEDLTPLSALLVDVAGDVEQAVRLFSEDGPPTEVVPRMLGAMRIHCHAQEALYPLRVVLPFLGRYFAEPRWHSRLAELDPEPREGVRTGLHRAKGKGDADRGAFTLYVPERYDSGTPRPLVVALHGGSGHGRQFVWAWLREARSRNFLVLSPTSIGSTWSLEYPDVDRTNIERMVAFVSQQWRVDAEHVLLTGLSDGATFALLGGLSPESPFTHLAPVSGVLAPTANLEAARRRRIYLVHGALDWMFPVPMARMARDQLQAAGAEVTYREITDLSHTYPREENDGILRWFDPRLGADAAE